MPFSRFSFYRGNTAVKLFSGLLVFCCQTNLAHENHDHNVEKTGYTLSVNHYQIPEVSLVNANGDITNLSVALDNTPLLLNFIFTSCTAICPTLSATFSQVQKQLATTNKNVNFVSISIDPEYDTPKKLKKYAKIFTTGSNWNFYTGKTNDIVNIQRSFDAYRGSKMNHIPLTYIRAKQDAPWVRIEGFTSAKNIIDELRKASQQ